MHLGIYTYRHLFIPLDHSVQLQTFNSLQKDLQSFITPKNDQILPFLSLVNALLHLAVSTCKAAIQTSEPLQDLGEKENIPPRKSLEHQCRFIKTCKSPGRKKWKCTKINFKTVVSITNYVNTTIHRCADNEEKAKIIDKLENDLNEVLICTLKHTYVQLYIYQVLHNTYKEQPLASTKSIMFKNVHKHQENVGDVAISLGKSFYHFAFAC